MTQVASRHGRLLCPLWVDPAEILRGRQARGWLRMMRILLGWVDLRGCNCRKTEKRVKNRRFSQFLDGVAPRHGQLLGPLWADLAEISCGQRARVWVLTMRISLGQVEVRGRSGQKTGEN